MEGDQNPGPVAPSRSRRGIERREQRKQKGRSNCQRSDRKGRYVRVIEGEEVRRNDPVKYFLPTGVRSNSCVSEGMMAVEVPQNEEISRGENGKRKGVGFAIR